MNRQANMAGLSPLTVVSWNEFVADPTVMYNLFWRNPQTGQFQFDPQYVSVMAGTNSRVLKVSTVEELTRLEQELMSKPILLDVSTQYSKTENYVVVRVTTTWRGSFAVLLNPLHPMVRQPMEEMFRKGVDLIASGKKFCLEFDLGSCMEAWYADMLGSTNGCYDRSKSANTRFYITNSSKYQHCFDCNPWWFVFGFSCWLLSAPFYLIHRACTVDDSLLNFNLPVVMRTPLSQNRALEIHPSNNYDQAAANRQVLMNRANQQQSFHDPEVYAPDGGAYRGGPPPPGVGPVNPPPYSPPPYQPQQDPNSSAVVQQPGRPATAPDQNIV